MLAQARTSLKQELDAVLTRPSPITSFLSGYFRWHSGRRTLEFRSNLLPCYPSRAGQSYQWREQVTRTQHWSDLHWPLWLWQCGPCLHLIVLGCLRIVSEEIVSPNFISCRQFLGSWSSFQSHKTVDSINVLGHTGREHRRMGKVIDTFLFIWEKQIYSVKYVFEESSWKKNYYGKVVHSRCAQHRLCPPLPQSPENIWKIAHCLDLPIWPHKASWACCGIAAIPLKALGTPSLTQRRVPSGRVQRGMERLLHIVESFWTQGWCLKTGVYQHSLKISKLAKKRSLDQTDKLLPL